MKYMVMIVLGFILGGLTVQAQPDDTTLQGLLNGAIEGGGFAGILVQISDGDEVELLSAGWADLDQTTPIAGEEHFRIGSVTKLFTAVAALQLVGEGRIALDDPVQQVLPEVLPSALPEITIQQLLEHTSGLNDYERALGFDNTANVLRDRSRGWTRDDLLAFALEQPPVALPGETWFYSSTNYVLLGAVIEAVTGEPYGRVIERSILEPLNLANTSFPQDATDLPRPYLHGYTPAVNSAALIDISEWNPSVTGAAGEMISTARDLDRFIEALMEGELLDETQQEALLRPITTMPEGLPPGFGAGMGISFMPTSCGMTIYGGGGAVPGYITSLFASEDHTRRVVIAFTLKTTMSQADQLAIQQITDATFCL